MNPPFLWKTVSGRRPRFVHTSSFICTDRAGVFTSWYFPIILSIISGVIRGRSAIVMKTLSFIPASSTAWTMSFTKPFPGVWRIETCALFSRNFESHLIVFSTFGDVATKIRSMFPAPNNASRTYSINGFPISSVRGFSSIESRFPFPPAIIRASMRFLRM